MKFADEVPAGGAPAAGGGMRRQADRDCGAQAIPGDFQCVLQNGRPRRSAGVLHQQHRWQQHHLQRRGACCELPHLPDRQILKHAVRPGCTADQAGAMPAIVLELYFHNENTYTLQAQMQN